MSCSRCGLPFTDDYPEYNPGSGYHEAGACIRGLRASLAEAQKLVVFAAGIYEEQKADATARIAELEAENEKLQVTVNDLRAVLADKRPATAEFGTRMYAEGFEFGKLKYNVRIAALEAELTKMREQIETMIALAGERPLPVVTWAATEWGDSIEKKLPMPPAPEVKS